jgi:hypothetical protein
MGFADAVQYLVVQRLIGSRVVDIVEMYLRGCSPSEISRAMGISRYAVRGYIQRVIEKGLSGSRMAMLKRVIPYIQRVEPAVAGGRCTLCGAVFTTDSSYPYVVQTYLYMHMVSRHMDHVSKTTRDVISKLSIAVQMPRG